MCLIALAWQAHPAWPLVVAANRDEFFARPTAPAQYWPDLAQVLARIFSGARGDLRRIARVLDGKRVGTALHPER